MRVSPSETLQTPWAARNPAIRAISCMVRHPTDRRGPRRSGSVAADEAGDGGTYGGARGRGVVEVAGDGEAVAEREEHQRGAVRVRMAGGDEQVPQCVPEPSAETVDHAANGVL